MSNSNEFLKKCFRCEIIQVIENFNKDKNRKDGLNSICKLCRKKYYNDSLIKIKNIMNKIKKEETYILKTNDKQTLIFE